MKTRKTLTLLAIGILAALIFIPAPTLATRGPFQRLSPIYFDSDPEVPDAGEPPRALVSNYESATIESDRADTRVTTRFIAHAENWYRRILRALRAAVLGGLVR
jgi:hypothetical protein